MPFCPKCHELMEKHPVDSGDVIFQCSCSRVVGGPDDTLMDSEYPDTSGSIANHAVFIENSAHDPAANIVMKDCPQCGLNFVAIIQVGVNDVTMYTCTCGMKMTHLEYIAAVTP